MALQAVAAWAGREALAFAQPAIETDLSWFRLQLGWNEIGQKRSVAYAQERDSTKASTLTDNYTPYKFTFPQAIRSFNQGPWPRADNDAQLREQLWGALQDDLRYCGVYMALTGSMRGVAATDENEINARYWHRMVEMMSAPAPIESVIRDFYRSVPAEAALKAVSQDDLNYCLQRGEFRRKKDRDRLLEPFFDWSREEIQKLYWLGALRNDQYAALLNAAGMVQGEDAGYYDLLSQYLPDPQTLAGWTAQGRFGGDALELLGLGGAVAAGDRGAYYARAGGVGVEGVAFPNEVAPRPDWYAMMVDAARPLPGLGEALEMQRRFRPSAADETQSVVPGIPTWSAAHTEAVLQTAGYTQEVIDRMMGLATEPLNIRIINEVLIETLKHPALLAAANLLFGAGVDWIKGAFLDHGYSDGVAQIASAAVRQKAADEADAEGLEIAKALRAEQRDLWLKAYSLGAIDDQTLVANLQDAYVTQQMAETFQEQAAQEIRAAYVEAVEEEIHKAFDAGQISSAQVIIQLQQLGITAQRQAELLQLWAWQRNSRVRTLSTGEILSALKGGMMTPATALVRLTNLGWTAPDATIEIALVEQDLAQAQARTAAVAGTKAAAAAAKAEAQAEATATKAAKASAAALKAKQRQQLEAALGPVQRKEYADQYAAEVLKAGSAWFTASGKSDQAGMQAALAGAISDYDTWLADQLELQYREEQANAPQEPVETGELTVPEQGSGSSAAPASTASQPGAAPAAGSGTAPAS